MSYVVNITATDYTVSASSTSTTVIITPAGDNTTTIITSNFTITTISTTSAISVFTDAVELIVDDFANYFRGDWAAGNYVRGELVNNRYSLFVCQTSTNTTLASTIEPSIDPVNWRMVVWREAPMASLTVTNTATIKDLIVTDNLTVGTLSGAGLVINSTATFNGITTFNSATFFNTTATFDRIKVANVLYPTDQGEYGQVLVTRGSTGTADWFNLGDLVFWSLSNNLYTNGFNIYTSDTDETLKIGASSGPNDSQFDSVIAFNPNNTSLYWTTPDEDAKNQIGLYNVKANGRINLKSDNVNIYGNTFARMVGQDTAEIRVGGGGVDIKGDRNNLTTGNVNIYGQLVLNKGITFPDNTIQTSTFKLTTATASILGGIKVGSTLNIDATTGVLNANTATDFRLGIVQPGRGLSMLGNGIIQADIAQYSSTTSGDIKLIGMMAVDSQFLSLVGPNSAILTINTATLAAALGALSYTLPIATAGTLGGIRVGDTLNIDAGTGILNADTATTSSLGVVQVGNNINVSAGVISVGTASNSTLGLVKIGDNVAINSDAVISINTATTSSLGVVYPDGTSISINHLGRISAIASLATIQIEENGYRWTNSATLLNFVGENVSIGLDNVNDVNVYLSSTMRVKQDDAYVQSPGSVYGTNTTTDFNFVGSVQVASTTSVDLNVPWAGNVFKRTTATIRVGVNTSEDGTAKGIVSSLLDFTGGLFSVSTSGNTSTISARLGLRDYTATTYSVGDQVWYNNKLWTYSSGGTNGTPGVGTNWIQAGQPGSASVQGQFKVGTGLETSGSAKDNLLNLSIATASTLGGIKIGSGLAINPSTGVVSVSNTASITDLVNDLYLNDYALKYYLTDPNASEFRFSTATTTLKHSSAAQLILNATTSSLSSNNSLLRVSEADVYLYNAHGEYRMNNTGIVLDQASYGSLRFISGSSILASKSALELSAAGAINQFGSSIKTSATTIVITGTNIDINGSVIDFIAPTLNIDSTNLDIDTTNFAVESTTATITATDLTLDATNITLDSTSLTFTAGDITFGGATTLGNTTTDLKLLGVNILSSSTGYTRIGATNLDSELYVQKIYNYAGNFAPFFPAGVQFNDNTVQITAWRGYDQGEL